MVQTKLRLEQIEDIYAVDIINVPAGGIAAVDVQGAIAELDTEKAGIADAETISADWLFSGDKKVQFRDPDVYVHSPTDGVLALVADVGIKLGGTILMVDVASGRVGIRLSTLADIDDTFHVLTPDAWAGMTFEQRRNDATPPILKFLKSRGGGAVAVDDWIGGLYFYAVNTTPAAVYFGEMGFWIKNPTAGSEEGEILFTVVDGSGGYSNTTFSSSGQLQLEVQGSAGGLLIGGDAHLYRGAADRLVLGAGDTLRIQGDDKIEWRDAAIYLASLNDGFLDMVADTAIRITSDLGLKVAAPQGLLHGYDAIGGIIHWEYDGVDGTARTVLLNGPGDVAYGLCGFSVVRASDASCQPGKTFGILPGGTTDIYTANMGADVCQLQVAADGTVTVQRTAGALTYKVTLWLVWL